jgi:hypothetical protein
LDGKVLAGKALAGKALGGKVFAGKYYPQLDRISYGSFTLFGLFSA